MKPTAQEADFEVSEATTTRLRVLCFGLVTIKLDLVWSQLS